MKGISTFYPTFFHVRDQFHLILQALFDLLIIVFVLSLGCKRQRDKLVCKDRHWKEN